MCDTQPHVERGLSLNRVSGRAPAVGAAPQGLLVRKVRLQSRMWTSTAQLATPTASEDLTARFVCPQGRASCPWGPHPQPAVWECPLARGVPAVPQNLAFDAVLPGCSIHSLSCPALPGKMWGLGTRACDFFGPLGLLMKAWVLGSALSSLPCPVSQS